MKKIMMRGRTKKSLFIVRNMDAIKRPRNSNSLFKAPHITIVSTFPKPPVLSQKAHWYRQYTYARVPFIAALVAIFLAFASGMWFEWRSDTSIAEQSIPASLEATAPRQETAATESVFTVPLRLLRQYMAGPSSQEIISARTAKLKKYLEAKSSPLSAYSGLIAAQQHWKIMLAVSFAESTLGKRCFFRNCSGIGGSNIKTYASTEEWITDFNALLDRRYKDSTLEEMCGVYVKPCNPNWLLATNQILGELEEAEIQ